MADKDRLEREISEILDKIEQFPTPQQRRARARRRSVGRAGAAMSGWQQALMRRLSGISVQDVMLASFVIILGAFFFRRFSPVLMQWALYGGIVLLVTSFAIMTFSRGRGGRGGSSAAYWRGRPVQYRSSSTLARVRQWFGSRRRRA
jgi:hypothetical protein